MAIDLNRILAGSKEPLKTNYGSLLRSQAVVDDPQSYMSRIDAMRNPSPNEGLAAQVAAYTGQQDAPYSAFPTDTPVPASFDYQSPLDASYKITQRYGNYNPGLYRGITKDSRHKGVDFATPMGTKVAAPIGGRIETGSDKNWGNYVLLHGDDGVTYRFSHLSGGANKPGRVNAGSVIGLTGSSGNSTGPHLDISTQVNGKFVDPLSLAVFRRYMTGA